MSVLILERRLSPGGDTTAAPAISPLWGSIRLRNSGYFPPLGLNTPSWRPIALAVDTCASPPHYIQSRQSPRPWGRDGKARFKIGVTLLLIHPEIVHRRFCAIVDSEALRRRLRISFATRIRFAIRHGTKERFSIEHRL